MERSSDTFDVIVVGSGIIGLSIAYHMKLGNPDLEILLVDKEPSAGQGDTAKSAAALRNVFTSEVNRLLADSSLDFYLHVQNHLEFNLDLILVGYLWLLTDTIFSNLHGAIRSLTASGVQLKLWEIDELMEMIPSAQLRIPPDDKEAKIAGLEGVTRGLQGLKCGTASPELITGFYEQEFKKMGGHIKFRTRVESIMLEPTRKTGILGEPFLWQNKKIVGVRTQAGNIQAGTTIVAAGCWATDILNTVGIDSHIRPKKRNLFVLSSPDTQKLLRAEGFNRHDLLPMTILPKGVFMRPTPREGSFWVGGADDLGRPFKFEDDPKADPNYYYQNLYPVLSKYFPQYKDLRPANMWAGLYDINTLDANPWIFKEEGIIVASGLSGSGIMKADAVGRIVEALYEGKEQAALYGGRTINVARLGLQDRDVGAEKFVL